MFSIKCAQRHLALNFWTDLDEETPPGPAAHAHELTHILLDALDCDILGLNKQHLILLTQRKKEREREKEHKNINLKIGTSRKKKRAWKKIIYGHKAKLLIGS